MPKACDCPEVLSAALVRPTSTQTYMAITFSNAPPGGFIVRYQSYSGGTATQVSYPASSTSPIQFPVTGNDYDVKVYANCNQGEPILCYHDRVTIVDPPGPCKRWVNSTSTIKLERLSSGQYRLKIVREMPPSPTAPTSCEVLQLSYQQYDNYTPSLQGQNGSVHLSSADFIYQTNVPNDTAYVILSPVFNTVQTSYQVTLIDCCNAQFSPDPGKFWTKTGEPA
ncbi:MAG: hypothetical protein EOP52_13490 [Sphingobacteriales bacterium]|nr:MAG: hypothetical protein EOP52_13490 [Sphingobacteriales bacterium]